MSTTAYANTSPALPLPRGGVGTGSDWPRFFLDGEVGRAVSAVSVAAALTYLYVACIGFPAASAVCAFLVLTVMAFELIPPQGRSPKDL